MPRGPEDRWVFKGIGGQAITLAAESFEFDIHLSLLDDSGRQIAWSDGSGALPGPRIHTSLPGTGIYTAKICGANHEQFGTYWLSLNEGQQDADWSQAGIQAYYDRGVEWAGRRSSHRAISWLDLGMGRYLRSRRQLSEAERLNPSSWNMPQVFTVVTVARGLLLGQFIMIALRLTSPFIIAIAIDEKMAHHVAYPYVKGAAAFTLIAPAVGAIVGIFAYAAANVPLTAIDFNNPIFKLNPDTLMIEGDPSRAVYPALIGAALMLVSALALFASPYVSYRVASGQVFEGVSGVMSGWMGALTGMAVELAGVRHAAGLERQAQETQIHGVYGGEVTRAGAGFEAANFGVQARKLAAMAGARGALTATLGQIYGARTQSIQQAQAGALFGVSSAGANAALAKGDIGVRRDRGVADLDASRQREFDLFEANRSADTKKWLGDKLIMGSTYAGDTIRGVTKGEGGKTETVGKLGAAGVEIVGGGVGLYEQYKSIQDRAAGQKGAVSTSTEKMVENQERAASGFTGNQDMYVRQMTDIHQRYAQDQIAAVRAGADQAAGGASRGTSITMGGINRGAAIELQANRTMMEGSIAAAGQVRDAGLQAARLHMAATIIHQMSRDAARQIEQGLILRY